MKRIATIALLAILFGVTAAGQSKPKDVLGWEGTRWGMAPEDIAKLFGSRTSRVPSVELYGKWYYLYTVSVNLEGQTFTAFPLMDEDKLARVDVRLDEYESPVPREDVFNALDSMLTAKYGQPDSKKDERQSDQWKIGRTWKFPTSTVELWLAWRDDEHHSSNVGINYYPTAVVKP